MADGPIAYLIDCECIQVFVVVRVESLVHIDGPGYYWNPSGSVIQMEGKPWLLPGFFVGINLSSYSDRFF